MGHNGVAGITCLVAVSIWATPLLADIVTCKDPLLRVDANDQGEANRVCDAAIRAKGFVSTCGIGQNIPVTLELRDEIPGVSDHCAGVYQQGSHKILLVRPSAMPRLMPQDSAFTTLDDDAYYDSLVVHELAHAFSDQSSENNLACSADKEYIAYALQIESLPDAERRKFLPFQEVDHPVPEARLNDFVLGFAPDVFGLMAWAHFSEAGHGCQFIADLLDGRASLALPDLE